MKNISHALGVTFLFYVTGFNNSIKHRWVTHLCGNNSIQRTTNGDIETFLKSKTWQVFQNLPGL
jgi:hypothetical protein